jgi:hypothetical protein
LKLTYLHRALSLVDSELELVHLKIQYPEQFLQSDQLTFKSDLYFDPKSKEGLGFIGMAEFVIGFHLLTEIPDASGKPADLIQFSRTFEQAFNFKFGDIYELKNQIFRRKPYNRTKALDMLRNAIIREDRKRNSQ